ncbi:MAG: hypothetical protein PHU94_05225 [Bacilli bacterium]|nr:hypothetical protein [Bacilli bacterium]
MENEELIKKITKEEVSEEEDDSEDEEDSEDDSDEVVVDEDLVKLDSFKVYPSSEDDETKIVDGEKVVEDFHLYEENDDEED